MELRQIIKADALKTIAFSEITTELNKLTNEQKAEFAALCVRADSQLSSYLQLICLRVAEEKADTAMVPINASGKVNLADVEKYIKQAHK